MHFETRAIRVGQEPDPATGAIIPPIYATSNFQRHSIDQQEGYSYSRVSNPTRAAAEQCLAALENARYGLRVGAEKGHIGMMETTRAEGFGKEVIQRIIIGTYALSSGYYDAFYLKAQKGRTLLRQQFDAVFQQVDALVSPVSPIPAFKIGELVDDPLAMKLADVLTIPVNLAGLPGLSVPCGFVNGLPVGLQIIGKPFDELTVLRIGYVWEQLACLRDELRQPKGLTEARI